jgi:hypothetical protein
MTLDPTWARCFFLGLNKRSIAVQYNYCDKLCTPGITRIKYHINEGYNVTKCHKVPITPMNEETFHINIWILKLDCEPNNLKTPINFVTKHLHGGAELKMVEQNSSKHS